MGGKKYMQKGKMKRGRLKKQKKNLHIKTIASQGGKYT